MESELARRTWGPERRPSQREGRVPASGLTGGSRPSGGRPLACGHAGRAQVLGLCWEKK